VASEIQAESEAAGALGVWWDPEATELVLVVPRTGSRPTLDDYADRGLKMRLQTSDVTPADFERAKALLLDLVQAGTLDGQTTELSLDLPAGNIQIASTAEREVFNGLMSTLGDQVVFKPAVGSLRRLASRIDDFPPYYGGGALWKPNSGVCTAGYAVRRSGTAYMVTAGHCFGGLGVGTTIDDGSGDFFGKIRFRAAYPARDIELIGDSSYGGYIFRGINASNPSVGQVLGAGDPVVGFSDYCSSGFATLEICGLQATGVHVFQCDPDNHCTDKMARFAGDNHWEQGDSGGPIFAKYGSGSNVTARATIIGEWSGSAYGQEWSAIANTFGATICGDATC
jgi:hypothetical protein